MKSIKSLILSLSIHKKLAIGIFFIISFIFLSTALIALNIANKQTSTIVEELIDSNIKSNKEFIVSTILAGDSWKLFKFLKSLTQNSTIQEAGIVNDNQKIVAHSMPRRYRIGDNYKLLESQKTIPLEYNGITLGSIVLIVENSSINQMLKSVFLQNAFFLIAAAMFSFIIASVSTKKLLDRFNIILSNMNAISQKKWNQIRSNESNEKDEISSIIDKSILVMDDIKKAIEKEESLRLFYRDILKSIDSFIVICDKNMNIKYHNEHLLNSILLVKGKTSFYEKHIEKIKKNALKQNTFTIELSENSTIYLLVNIQYIEENTVIHFSDITKIKEIEENEKIVHSLQVVGEISSQFAHEIKNLLQPLTLLIPKKELPDKEDLPMIHNTIVKMREQVSDFLLLGKPLEIDSNNKENAIDIFNEALTLFTLAIQNKKLTINKELPQALHIQLNKKHIEVIVVNLIKNAIEASYEKESIDISWSQNKNESIFKITNKGQEIKDTKKIFKPFFTTKQEGSGLGLFSIYKIIHTIKGRIEVQSKDEQTTFTVFIPNRIEI